MDYSRLSGQPTQDHVLGNFQSSLRDCSLADANPGLRPGLLSAVPPGLKWETVVLTQARKPLR
jgi:hypothetical protein